ncbi:hypothetical protein CYY_000286 [Polysphondylium violaceum]|uniref:EF-hand domain-containing protein n=1 Tax=Polysphondylium violaceum TaxID=133409 RepID=A0A8J4VBQ0_9MYCE|nr:hypothetical protein CYY_000286 [Polysphondylium violaceum]
MGAGQSLTASETRELCAKTTFTKDNISQIEKDFKKSADLDKSGGLNQAEFVKFFSSRLSNWSEETLNVIFKAFDTDKSGFLSCKECVAALYVLTKSPPQEKLGWIFDAFDQDNSGTLDYNELLQIRAVFVGTAIAFGEREFDLIDKAFTFEEGMKVEKKAFIATLINHGKFLRLIGFYENGEYSLY